MFFLFFRNFLSPIDFSGLERESDFGFTGWASVHDFGHRTQSRRKSTNVSTCKCKYNFLNRYLLSKVFTRWIHSQINIKQTSARQTHKINKFMYEWMKLTIFCYNNIFLFYSVCSLILCMRNLKNNLTFLK